ncbi:hypothetical protein SAMD00019534_010220, partial [Acytostelium subglobosum LB1]|uniref:hypothetical protein n=1 Tax=Acytostelium subglobosum LB1 TaxID=1410327 RepID=UPI000644E56D
IEMLRNGLFVIAFTLTLILVVNIEYVDAKTSSYYTSVNDISKGINYYSQLNLNNNATQREIKTAFRKLSLEHHPDKNNGVTSDEYVVITNAYQILSDQETKEEYDDLLINGIPWHENYVGRYAYHYTGVSHDVRHVLAGLILVITLGKHFYQVHRHNRMQGLAMKTQRYQEAMQQEGAPPQVVVKGAEKPTWKDLFILQLLMVPVRILKFLYRIVVVQRLRFQKTQEEIEEEYRIAQGMTREEFDKYKEDYAKRMERFKQSNRYKKMVRYMKN